MHGTYCDLVTLKSELGLPTADIADDATLLRKLENASRWIDAYCKRPFYVTSQTRYFTAPSSAGLFVPDLLSISTLKTDDDGDRTYETTWTVTDYDLEPFNKFPKWTIGVAPNGDYSFPTGIKAIEIAGLWGYGNADPDGNGGSATPYEDSGTTTAEVLDTTETGVDVANGPALSAGQTILVESEQLYVRSISGNTVTVTRGCNGTTAATHVTSSAIYIWRYPGTIQEACLIQASRLFRRKDAPFGMVGSAEMGYSGTIARLDPDVRNLIDDFRRLVAV